MATPTKSLDEIFGGGTSKQPPQNTSKQRSLDDIFGKGSQQQAPSSSPKPVPKKNKQLSLSDVYKATNPLTIPWKEYDPTKMGVIGQSVTAFSAGYSEGFQYSKNIVRGEERLTKALKPSTAAGRLFGEFSREFLLWTTGGQVVKALKTVPWIAKAAEGTKAAEALSKHAPKLIQAFGEAAVKGSVVTATQQITAPKERKPGAKGLGMNIAMSAFGELGSDAGRSVAKSVLAKNVPKINPHLENLAALIGDTTASTIAGMPFVDDKKELLKSAFGADVLAIGAYDLIAYAATKGKVKPEFIPHVEHAATTLDEALETGSETAEMEAWEAMNKAKVNDNTDIDSLFDELEDTQTNKSVLADAMPEIVMRAPKEDVDPILQQELPLTSKVTSQQARKLAGTKPPDAPFNLERIDAREGTLIAIDEFARESWDRTVVPLAETEALAKQELQMDSTKWATLEDEFQDKLTEAKEFYNMTGRLPEQITKLRAYHAASYGQMIDLAEMVDSGNASELDMAQFVYRVQYHNSLTPLVKGVSTNIARTLSAHRIIVPEKGWVNLGSLTPDDLITSRDAQSKLVDVIDGAGGIEGIKKMAKKMLETKTLGEGTKAARKLVTDSPMQKLATWFQSSILTNPTTHMVNMAGQAINQALENVTDFTQVAVGNLREFAAPATSVEDRMKLTDATKRLTGSIQGFFHAFLNPVSTLSDTDGMRHIVEAPSITDYLFKMLKFPLTAPVNAIKNIGTAVLNPKAFNERVQSSSLDPYTKAVTEAPKLVNTDNPINIAVDNSLTIAQKTFGYIGELQKAVSFSVLELTDRPLAYAGYFSEMKAQVDRFVDMSGLEGRKAKADFRGKLEQAIVAYRKMQKGEGDFPANLQTYEVNGETINLVEAVKYIDESSIQHEQYMTWKDEIGPGLVKDFETNILRKYPVTRFFFPFFHTPVKILEKWWQYTPVDAVGRAGLATAAKVIPSLKNTAMWSGKAMNDFNGLNGAAAQDRMIAKWVTGTAIYGIAGALVLMGKVTPSAINEQQKQRMKDAGVQEKSMLINGKWVEINRLDPAAMFVGLMADAINVCSQLDDDTAEAVFEGLLLASAKNTTEKTYMQGFKNLTMLMSGQKSQLPSRIAEGFIPFSGLGRYVREISNDSLWEAESLMERLQLVTTRDALDSFGKPIPTPDRIWGLKVSEPSDSPVRIEAGRVGANFTPPGDTVFQTKLTDDQRWPIHKSMEDTYKVEDKLNELVASDEYQQSSDVVKKELLERTYDSWKLTAEAEAFKNDSNLQQAYNQVIEALVQGYQGSDSSKKTFSPWFN